MMQNVRRVVSEYGFSGDVAKRCPECGHAAQIVVVTGEEKGKFGAFQVECANCMRCSPLALFFKFDDQGNLERVNPFAREAVEGLWNMMAEPPGTTLPPFDAEDYSLLRREDEDAWEDEDPEK